MGSVFFVQGEVDGQSLEITLPNDTKMKYGVLVAELVEGWTEDDYTLLGVAEADVTVK